MEDRRRGRNALPRILRFVLILSAVLFVNSCARDRIPSQPPHRAPEKRIEKKGIYHVVERHQTLFRICKTYGVDIREVASLNGVSDVNRIQTGRRIFIPGAEKELKVDIYVDDVVQESSGGEKETGRIRELDFLWPVEGPCVNFFQDAERNPHQGLDIASPSGTPVKASNSGRVVYSGNTVRGYGNLIILRHSEEWVTVYAHNQLNLVKEGMWVERGEVIARVGRSGRASGPHLHFEIRRNNRAVNPLLFLKSNAEPVDPHRQIP